jgi:hypothetical protein
MYRVPPTSVAAADRPAARLVAGNPDAPFVTRVLVREILSRERRLGVGGRMLVDLTSRFGRHGRA